MAFKLICVLDDKEPEQMLNRYADILAVATVGDVMPIVNENRSIVRAGVNKIRRSPNTGLAAVLNVAGVDRNTVSGSKISFGITPRINAAGRMGSADRALNLLLSDNMMDALKIANEIDADNVRRQQIEREICESAFKEIEQNGYQNDRIIVVAGDGWHMGVTGIVASRICEKYGKPAIVLSREGDTAHGSGRSFDGFNLFDAITNSSKNLTRYGGHALAAGVSLHSDMIDTFRKEINEYAASLPFTAPVLNIDFKLNPAGLSVDMANVIKTLEPFGNGNPTPLFAITDAKLTRITELSNGKHLKLLFSKGDSVFYALLFGVSLDRFCFRVGDTLDLAVNLDTNFYKDEYTLSVIIKAIRMSGTDDQRLFGDIEAYENYMTGREFSKQAVCPTRSEIGEVYKLIRVEPVSPERIKYALLNTVGFAKTQTALSVLSELDLITLSGGVYKTTDSSHKELTESKIYSELMG